MVSPCKRMRLKADDDDDDNKDDAVVVAAVRNNDYISGNKAEVKTENKLSPSPSTNNDADANTACLTPEEKPEAIDLTVDASPGDIRRNFSHTAEVIKARYIKALQQFQRVSSLIDAISAQQLKLEARREHLQGLMSALSTMYKVVKGQHRPARTPTVPLIYVTEAPHSIPLTAADSQVTSSTEYLSVDEGSRDAVHDLKLSDGLAATDLGARWDLQGTGDGGPTDTILVAAHTSRSRVDISSSSFDCPPPAHTTRVDISGYTYIVRNSDDVDATDDMQ